MAACVLGASLGGAPVLAQVTWDANTSTSGPQDGSGTWSTSDANWWNGTTDVVWPNLTTSSAIIGANSGAAGTITASGSLTLNAITFNAPGSGTYTLTGGTLGFAGSSPTITANANATIESAIVSTGLTKSGTGNLTLAGIITNTSGAMSFSRGTVTLTGTLTYTSASTFAIGSANGGTLTIAGGTFSANGGGGARQVVIAGGAGLSGTVAVSSGFFSPVGMLVSEDSGGNGVFTQSGGTTTIGASSLWLTGNSSTLTVSGGSFTTPAMYTNFGNSNSATTINVRGSGSLTVNGNVQVGTGGRNGINLIVNVGDGSGGGTLQVNSITWGGATGTATINFNSGTFVANATTSLPAQISTVIQSGGANISVAASQTLTMPGPLTAGSGAGGLRKLGAGTLSLTGTNTYTGTTSIAAGSLSIGNALALQNSTLDLAASDAGTVSAISQNSTLGGLTGSRNLDMLTRTLSIGNNNANTTYSGTLSNGALTKIGSGTLTLTASNSYSGATTISAGALALSTVGNLVSTGTVAITGSGAAFDISGASAGRTIGMLTGTAGSSVALGANSLTVGDATSGTFAGAIGGSGGLTKQGAGTLVLSGSSGYSGGTTINNGTIMLSGAGTLGSGTAGLTLGGGALDLGGLSVSAGNVSITSAPSSGNQIQNGTLTGTAFSVSNSSGVSTVSASLAGTGAALSKSGAGTLVLSGSNSFSGGVTLTGGQVQIANANALGTGTFTTNVDAATSIVFNLPTSGTVANAITINKPGANRTYDIYQNQANNVTLSGNITIASGNGNVFRLGSGLTSGTFTLTGSNTFGSDVGAGANITFRIGGTNAAGTVIWRPDATTKLVLLDGANFRAGVGNNIASFSMESSGTATVSGNVWNRNTANVVVDTPAGAQLTFAGIIYAEGGFQTGTFSKTGAGTWVVNNSGNQMTYNILGGALQVPSFTALGGSTAASYVVLDGGTLRYTGAAASTAREFTLGASGGSLDASGSGTAAFTSAAAVAFTGSGNRTLTLTGTNTGNNLLAAALANNGVDVVSLSKAGAGTWVVSGSSTYSGATAVQAGVMRFSTVASGTAAQNLGSGSVVNLGVAATSAGELDYTGSGGTFDKNVFALGAGRNRIRNSGAGTLTLSGTLTKNGTILELASGTFAVTGQITGASANSDLFINGASVTLSNTNNDYNGPTYVYGNGTLTLGASNVVPAGSALLLGGTGSDTGAGTIVTGTFTDTVASLTTSALSGTVGITVSGATAGGLTMTNLTLGGANDTLALTLSGLTQTRYTLLSYTGLRSGTFDTVSGTSGLSNYTLVYGSGSNGSIDLALKANQTLSLSPAASRVLVGGSTTLAGTLVNTQAVGGADLVVSLTSTGTLTANNFSSSTGATVAAGGTSTISATLLAGNTVGSRSWSVVNTDSGAITTTATSTGSISVVNQRTFTTSASTLALGLVHQGALIGPPTVVVTSTGLFATTASGTLGSFTGGPGGLSLATSDPTAFNGGLASQFATYAISGTASTPGTISGTFTSSVAAELGSISAVTVAVTGQVFSGTATWNVAGGGAWGSGASGNWTSAGGVGAAPGTFAGYTNTDVAIFAGSQGSTSSILLNGATPSLASLVFTTTTSRYVIDQGSGGSLTLAAAAGMPTVDVVSGGLHEIKAAILGSNGLNKIGGGTLVLSGSNGFTGGTDISAGVLVVDGSLGGAVNVAGGATLAGAGSLGGLATVANGGGLTPGNAIPGTFAAGGGLSLADAAILNFQLNPTDFTAGGGVNDLVTVTGDFTLDGVLNVAAIGGGDFTGVANYTSWRLFNYSGGAFADNGLTFGSMPSLGGDRYYKIDTSTSGVVNLVVVPEPGACVVAGIGLAGAAWAASRRRRRTP